MDKVKRGADLVAPLFTFYKLIIRIRNHCSGGFKKNCVLTIHCLHPPHKNMRWI